MPPPTTWISHGSSLVLSALKTLPPGGRWLAAGETDEERRNVPKRMHQNKTHLTWLSLWESWRKSLIFV